MDGGDISGQLNLPPGFRFHPTDEELVVHYLKRRLASDSCPLPLSIIAEIDLYKYNPWDLPGLAKFGEHEWYFFSPRDRKYPNGARPNRAASSGYWKATGTDKPVLTSASCPSFSSSSHGNTSTSSSRKVGVKKALVFYKGKPPKGIKTNWIMHEYRLTDPPLPLSIPPPSSRPHSFVPRKSLRLDDWVLCRIYKKAHAPKQEPEEESHVAMMAMDTATLPHLGSSSLATWLVENNIVPQTSSHLDTIQPQHTLPFTSTTPNMVSSMSPYIPKLLENEEEPELFRYNAILAPSRQGPCANVVDNDGSSPIKRGFLGSLHNTHLSMTRAPPSTPPNQPGGDIHTNTLQWPFLEDKYRFHI